MNYQSSGFNSLFFIIDNMHISLLQTDLVWEDKEANLLHLQQQLELLPALTDLVILPEMFTTGFSMNTHSLAEPSDGHTVRTLQQLALRYKTALAGSFMACHPIAGTSPLFYNRGFFITPEGKNYFYDKHHLFRMGQESLHFTPGNNRPIIHYQGWNILLQVCYDLRFPVWSRNQNNEYDLLIYVANWPTARRRAWDTLLAARAIENQCYVCGVNRTGTDGYQLSYNGGSALYSPKGEKLASVADEHEGMTSRHLQLDELQHFRQKFPAWKDADHFQLLVENENKSMTI